LLDSLLQEKQLRYNDEEIFQEMPVKTDKLVQVLCLMFLTYWLLKTFLVSVSVISQEMAAEGKLFTSEKVDSDNVKYVSTITYSEFLDGLLQEKESVLSEFIDILKKSEFQTYFFETPKITKDTMKKTTFEFVLARAQALESVTADESTFQEYFGLCDKERKVTNFENLGRDAMMVVPCPVNQDRQVYSSLAPFMREGPVEQVEEFWKTSARVMKEHVKKKSSKNPTWMSTSGLGVYWLHLRLDSRPKYYTFTPYRH